MPEVKKRKTNRRSLRPDIVIAVAATIISLCALGATLYQTYILKQQQHAAVWPRLELLHGWMREVESPYYRLTLRNTGIGPAIIRNVFIKHRDTSFTNFAKLATYIARQQGLPDSAAYQDYQDLLPEMVIPQQEEKSLLYLNQEPNLKYFINAINEIDIRVQYESLYGEAWEVTYPEIHHRKID